MNGKYQASLPSWSETVWDVAFEMAINKQIERKQRKKITLLKHMEQSVLELNAAFT